MRVVLDTNVLLSGLFTRGICEKILDVCSDNPPATALISSEHILHEFATHARSTFKVPVEIVTETIAKMRGRMVIVEPIEVASDACRDPNDLPVLGTAMAGHADYIVTGDQDLLVLKSHLGIPILSPREFFDLVRTGA